MLKSFLLLSALGLSSQPITNLSTVTTPVLKNKLKQTTQLKDNNSEYYSDVLSVGDYYNALQDVSTWTGQGLLDRVYGFLNKYQSKINFLNISYDSHSINHSNHILCCRNEYGSNNAVNELISYYQRIIREQLEVYVAAKVMGDCLAYLIQYADVDNKLKAEIVDKWFEMTYFVFTKKQSIDLDYIQSLTPDSNLSNVWKLKTPLQDPLLKQKIIDVITNQDLDSWKQIYNKYFSFYNFNIYKSHPINITGPNRSLYDAYWWYYSFRDNPLPFPSNWTHVIQGHNGDGPTYNVTFVDNEKESYVSDDGTSIELSGSYNLTAFVQDTDGWNNYYVDRINYTSQKDLSPYYLADFGSELNAIWSKQSLITLWIQDK
ncbi:hypothetical protein NX779_01480 [Mycoplasma cottewii]|uniref:Uncharacterized protein n=1 Tax=Mycoplasma cottewii TaxID=51364 RepID=A0ABY5U0A8_9MOLU|nr:hypothetical protein [Mycoplasma cottewii]UWD35291.1 hypothetical protein NX779_01480 [Mycoplasma cottewii]